MQPVSNERRIQTVCLVILSAVAIGIGLYWLSPVLIPFVLAVFLSYALMPVIDIQIRYLRFPRSVALVTTVLLACALLALIFLLVFTTVNQMYNDVNEYEKQLTALSVWAVERLPLEHFGIDTEALIRETKRGINGDDSTTGPKSLTPTPDSLTSPILKPEARAGPPVPSDDATTPVLVSEELASPTISLLQIPRAAVTGFLSSTLGGIMNVVSQGIMVLIFVIFMMIGKHAGKIPKDSILHEVQSRVQRYILTLLFLSALTAVLVGTTLKVLGVPYALMFGFLAFLLNFIPNIGSIMATLLPLPVVLLSPELSVTAKVLAIAIPGTIQFVLGNLIAPKIMGQSLDLHPVVVLMALIFFGMIWGIVGMFLATPITAVTRILLEKVEFTRPVAELLAGRLEALAGGAGKA